MSENNNRMLTKKDLNKIFLRTYAYECSFNYVRQQHMGFIWSMAPALKKIYKDDPEGLAEACKRQISFFNTTPQIAPWVVGIETALEEENKKSGNNMGDVVAAVKTSLMGPISVIGDTMFLTGGFRLLAPTIGAALAIQGNWLAIPIFLMIFNIPHFLSRYFGIHLGYKWGSNFFDKIMASGLINKVTEVCYILGLTMIGAVSAGYVSVGTPLAYGTGESAVTVQGILDSLFLNMLPLGVIMLCLWLMKKKNVPAHILIFLLMIIGIIGGALGILC